MCFRSDTLLNKIAAVRGIVTWGSFYLNKSAPCTKQHGGLCGFCLYFARSFPCSPLRFPLPLHRRFIGIISCAVSAEYPVCRFRITAVAVDGLFKARKQLAEIGLQKRRLLFAEHTRRIGGIRFPLFPQARKSFLYALKGATSSTFQPVPLEQRCAFFSICCRSFFRVLFQYKPQVPDSVGNGSQFGNALCLSAAQNDRCFTDPKPFSGCLSDHFCRKFHTFCFKMHLFGSGFCQAAQSAVKIM